MTELKRMQSDSLNYVIECIVCSETFCDTKLPYTLNCCGQIVCSSCFSQTQMRCPNCRGDLSKYKRKVNLQLLHLLSTLCYNCKKFCHGTTICTEKDCFKAFCDTCLVPHRRQEVLDSHDTLYDMMKTVHEQTGKLVEIFTKVDSFKERIDQFQKQLQEAKDNPEPKTVDLKALTELHANVEADFAKEFAKPTKRLVNQMLDRMDDMNNVLCYDIITLKWTVPKPTEGGSITCLVATQIENKLLVCCKNSPHVYEFDTTNRSYTPLTQDLKLDADEVLTSVAGADENNEKVYVGSSKGNLFLLNKADKSQTLIGQTSDGSKITSVVFNENDLYVTCSGGFLFSVSIKEGSFKGEVAENAASATQVNVYDWKVLHETRRKPILGMLLTHGMDACFYLLLKDKIKVLKDGPEKDLIYVLGVGEIQDASQFAADNHGKLLVINKNGSEIMVLNQYGIKGSVLQNFHVDSNRINVEQADGDGNSLLQVPTSFSGITLSCKYDTIYIVGHTDEAQNIVCLQ